MTAERGGRQRLEFIALVVILAIATVLRLYAIGWGAPDKTHNYTYFADEFTYLRMLGEMNPAKLDFIPETYSPRAGPALLFPLGALFLLAERLSLIELRSSLEWYRAHPEELGRIIILARIFVAFFGVATVALVHWAGRRFFGGPAGLTAAAIVAFAPAHIMTSRFLVCDVPAGFFALAATLSGILFLERPDRFRRFVLAALFAGLAAGVKITAMALVGFLFVIPFLLPPGPAGRARSLLKNLLLSGILLGAFAALFNPALLHLDLVGRDFFFVRTAGGEGASSILASPREFLLTFRDATVWATSPFAVAAGIIGVAVASIRRTRADILILASFLPMILIELVTGLYGSNRYVPNFPFAAILAGSLLAWKSRPVRVASEALLVVALLNGFFWSAALVREQGRYPVLSESRDWINENIPEGTKIGIEEWVYLPQISPKRYECLRFTGPDADRAFTESEYFLVSGYNHNVLKPRLGDYALFKIWERTPTFWGIPYAPPPRCFDRLTIQTIYLYRRE